MPYTELDASTHCVCKSDHVSCMLVLVDHPNEWICQLHCE
jgi:hypothetical protein